ncbi:uncharacterized protein G2W53_039250 [Senna tora]|uniref:Uncharacterized protein n=1 Tax=Senna tora TaxID=362788 RepID=A0A834T119_9FABA|nr:uncharacterized protein G2W53_039250 [Senna tora]
MKRERVTADNSRWPVAACR